MYIKAKYTELHTHFTKWNEYLFTCMVVNIGKSKEVTGKN